ncbi:hypothetical protein [Ovoidimarina sediminis]|uniref:hypothetical protein n=1 Tax=Ovoidimarina sediminis TaxID=3079856 RepID=UPI00290E5685|nr:hypothetical protein [Rhodophyticola sp. MJ-SS7]MDU8945100.1 hypothetical protein [Rhodophyticola sp. MJ-SS7]
MIDILSHARKRRQELLDDVEALKADIEQLDTFLKTAELLEADAADETAAALAAQ